MQHLQTYVFSGRQSEIVLGVCALCIVHCNESRKMRISWTGQLKFSKDTEERREC